MIPVLAHSGPSGFAETLIAGPIFIVALVIGLCGVIFRYRPAALAGGIVSLLVALFLLLMAAPSGNSLPALWRVPVIPALVGIALIVLKRPAKK
jgi:hypothetical protein